ncbi:MAG: hypothetical protein HON90_10145, partial [Halobacteriovoraceae bacterium]|nr:hypothetical protein [Halobacteriovoraceae bacterium]
STHKRLASKQALYKKKQEGESRIEGLKKQQQHNLAEQKKLQDLYLVIGKDEFRNFVLAMLENLLIEQTNQELKKLCQGRYRIIQTNKKNKMASEFVIVDYFCDGQSRKVSTLSGGETFLVSLAMALALAELTRGHTQIDSLFIDEGFGTLDSESIQEVLELLVNIQNSGKQVGIISHIKELTSRIPVNIKLDKNHKGFSEVSILVN